jgi:uncharacterized protein (DUF1800 family)
MALDPRAAWLAVHRFGLGPRPGELSEAATDPRGWLLAQLEGPGDTPLLDARPSHVALQRAVVTALGDGGDDGRKAVRQLQRRTWRAEAEVRLQHAAGTDRPFHERLTWFWADHLTVSTTNNRIGHLVGAFEREVVRPGATGRFAALLAASTKHPAMLVYLDNAGSVGPDTVKAQRRDKGLNENLAREILELHTLGVDGGYRQGDVVALAELLTGWTVFGGPPLRKPRVDRPHGFTFREDLHQPGTKTFLGRRYAQGGVAEGEAALQALADHPSTARFVAGKLARHFLGPTAPSDLCEAMAGTFRQTRGDLGAVARTLVTHPASWRAAGPRPGGAPVPAARALDLSGWRGRRKAWPERAMEAQAWLGQPPYGAPSPAGWSIDPADWAGPEQVLRRVELAWRIGEAVGATVPEPAAWADEVLGVHLSDAVRQAVAQAPSRGEAVATVLAAPSFQWT